MSDEADLVCSAKGCRKTAQWALLWNNPRLHTDDRRKTWLACALGQRACRDNRTVVYRRLPRLFAELELAHGDGRFPRLFSSLVKADLLILDDWGPEPLLPEQARDLLEIIEDRYDSGSTLITSQVPIDRWYEIIGIPTLADAVLDRLLHNAHRIELAGESLRKRKAPEQAA